MAYQSGDLIQTNQYNQFVRGGFTGIRHDVPNVNSLWGVGFGSRGYGQVDTLPAVTTSNKVTAEQWNSLVSKINELRRHQVGETAWTPIPPSAAAGNPITIFSSIQSALNSCYAERMSAYRNGADIFSTPTPPYKWNTGANGQITITATWSDTDYNQARYFFNAGGKIRLTLASNYNDGLLRGLEWSGIINSLGTLEIGATSSTRYGGNPLSPNLVSNSVGYWDLQTGNQTLVSIGPVQLEYGSYGAGYGAEDSMTVRVRSNGVQGLRGDNGNVITFTIDFMDIGYVPPDPDPGSNIQIVPSVFVRPPSTYHLPTPIENPTITFSSSGFDSAAY